MKKSVVFALAVASGFSSGSAWAGSVTLPNTFADGAPAQASEVNANFSAVKSAVDDNNSRLGAAETNIANHTNGIINNANAIDAVAANVANNTTNISSHSSTLSSHAAAIANNTTNISNLSSTTSSNTAAIAGKQAQLIASCASGYALRVINPDGSIVCQPDTNSGGDITSVVAGSGLTGGGASGDVNLSIPTGGITSSHLASGAVGSAAIADGSIPATDLANEAGINFGGTASITTTLATCYAMTSLSAVSISVPSSGYIHVTASGQFCTYTGKVSTTLALDDAPGSSYISYDGENLAYDYSSADRGCGIGQFTPFAFENVYYVSAAGYYTYYVNGCVYVANNQTFFQSHPMVATFYPTRY